MTILQHLAKSDKAAFNNARRAMQKENRKRPKKLEMIDIADVPSKGNKPLVAWASRDFLVQMYDDNGYTRITINRTSIDNEGNWVDGITWDEIQKIKTDIGFHDYWALEVFPPNNHVVNVSNMRHIFLFQHKPDFAWSVESLVG